jgi:hypothetical protein
VHDTVDLEIRGIPSVFIASAAFVDAAVAQSSALGLDPARVFVEHPIQDRTDEEMRIIAEKAVEEILDHLRR